MLFGALIGWFIGLVLCLWNVVYLFMWVDRYNRDLLNIALGNKCRLRINWIVRAMFILVLTSGGAIIGHLVQ